MHLTGLLSEHRDPYSLSLWEETCIRVDEIYPFTSKRVILLGLAFPHSHLELHK